MGEICIGKDRCSGAQSFQVVKGPFVPDVPPDGSLFLASILTQGQLMEGLGNLLELWDKLPTVTHKSQETLDLSDVCQYWPLLNNLYLTFISGYSLGRDYMPQIGNLPSEQLTLGQLELMSGLLQLQNTASSLSRWLAGSLEKMTISSK